MVEATLNFQPGAAVPLSPPERIALLGNPNCGKTALFNLLTGSRQKVANYAGVTVERKEGISRTAGGRRVFVLDLPGAYSLNALSADEAVTRDVVTGKSSEALPDLLVCVTDATNLRLNLRLVLEARRLGLPMVVALNMTDMAKKQGITVDAAVLSRELGAAGDRDRRRAQRRGPGPARSPRRAGGRRHAAVLACARARRRARHAARGAPHPGPGGARADGQPGHQRQHRPAS